MPQSSTSWREREAKLERWIAGTVCDPEVGLFKLCMKSHFVEGSGRSYFFTSRWKYVLKYLFSKFQIFWVSRKFRVNIFRWTTQTMRSQGTWPARFRFKFYSVHYVLHWYLKIEHSQSWPLSNNSSVSSWINNLETWNFIGRISIIFKSVFQGFIIFEFFLTNLFPPTYASRKFGILNNIGW